MPELLLHSWEAPAEPGWTVPLSLNLPQRGLSAPSPQLPGGRLGAGAVWGSEVGTMLRGGGWRGRDLPAGGQSSGTGGHLARHVSQGVSHPFRTSEALTPESRALMWHLAGWGRGAAPHAEAKPHSCAGVSHSAAPIVTRLESEILPLLPLPGALHRYDVGVLPAQGSSPPVALLAEGERTPWQKAPAGIAAK